jgi:hypothetical protein
VAAGVDRDLEPLLDQRAGAVQRDARVDGAIVDRGAAAAEAAGRATSAAPVTSTRRTAITSCIARCR